MNPEDLREIEKIIGYKFKDDALLDQAFHHSSSVQNRVLSNERLEFFGDAILSIAICEALFNRFPQYLEGDLTKIKSMLVSRRTCSRIIKKLCLQEYLAVGKGMAGSRAITGSLAAGLLEALIAAIYLDGGFEQAKKFVVDSFDSIISAADAEQSHGNYKSMLQQHAQQNIGTTPIYAMLDEKGPDHNKCFEAEAVIGAKHFKSAWGNNKKEAEQKAAFNALIALGIIEEDNEM